MEFITPKNFDASKIAIGGVRVNPTTKSKTIPITFDDKQFIVKVPKLSIPVVWDKEDVPNKCTLEMSFRGEEDNENIAQFRKMMEEIDNAVLNKAQERAVEWFKKPMTRETCEFMYSPIVRLPADPRYASTFRVTMYKRKNVFELDAFDENKNKIEITNPAMLKGSNAMALIQCTGVWISGSKFGTTWKLNQVRIFPRVRETLTSMVDRVTPMKPGDVVVQQLTFSAPKAMANGGKTIYINHDDHPLVIVTPKMHCPFGMSVWPDGPKFSTELSFRDADTDNDIASFQAFMNDLESRVKMEAPSWFKGASCSFSSSLRQNNVQYPPTMKFSVPSIETTISAQVFDGTTGEPIAINEDNFGIFKGAKMTIVASCSGVWSHGSKYGISFRANKIVVWPSLVSKGFNLGDDDETVPEEAANVQEQESPSMEASGIAKEAFTDDEDV